MKFVVFDDKHCGLQGLAHKLEMEDNYVMYVTMVAGTNKFLVATQAATSINNIEQLLKFVQADVIIAKGEHWIHILDMLRANSKKVVGLCEFTGIPQLDASYEDTLLSSVGIKSVPEEMTKYVCGWWNGKRFTATAIVDKARRNSDGERGTVVECAGLIGRRCADYDIEYLETFAKLESYMKGLDYVGPVSLGYCYSDRSFCCSDLVIGFSHGITPALFEILPCSVTEFFQHIVAGEPVMLDSDYVMSVQVAVEPYPYKKSNSIKLEGFDSAKLKHFWAEHLYIDGDTYVGRDNVGYVTAHAFSNKLLRERIYKITLKSLKVPQLVYRTDIGRTPELTLLGV